MDALAVRELDAIGPRSPTHAAENKHAPTARGATCAVVVLLADDGADVEASSTRCASLENGTGVAYASVDDETPRQYGVGRTDIGAADATLSAAMLRALEREMCDCNAHRLARENNKFLNPGVDF